MENIAFRPRKSSPSSITVPGDLLSQKASPDDHLTHVKPGDGTFSSSSSSDDDEMPKSVQRNFAALGAMEHLGSEAHHEGAECAICHGAMIRPAVGGGCAHHACEECYLTWNEKKPSCPICRAPVWRITVDYEFARLVGCDLGKEARGTPRRSPLAAALDKDPEGAHTSPEASQPLRQVAVDGPAGLTLSNQGSTVVVTKILKENGADRAGIKVRDHVLAVNGTPVSNHSVACSFIERRCAVGDCVLTVQRPQSKWTLLRKVVKDLIAA